MSKPNRWSRLVALALLGLCGMVAAADKPSGPPLKFNWGAPTADYFTLYVAKDLGLFEQANLDPQFFFFQSGAPLGTLKGFLLVQFANAAFAIGQIAYKRLRARQPSLRDRNIFALLEKDAGRVGHYLWVQHQGIQCHQRFGPFHALGNTRHALERRSKWRAAQAAHKSGHLGRQIGGGLRHACPHNRQLALPVRVVEPVVEAPALDGVIQFTGSVAGQDSYGRNAGPHRAHLWNAYLVLAQVLEQKSFKGFVGTVHLVDQQHRAGGRGLQCLQQGAADQVTLLVDLALHIQAGTHAFSSAVMAQLRGTHMQQLRGVVPFVQRFALLQAVVTLQAQQLPLQSQPEGLGEFGLAHAGFTFEQ